jgi:uncharacterized membrane protein
MRRRLLLHRVFVVGLWGKALDGALELVGGVLLLLIPPARIHALVIALTQHELVEDPQDWLATALRHAAAQLSVGSQLFGAIYLLVHGLVKLVVVAGVLRGQRWAYPTAIGVLGLFIAYQAYRLSYAFSPGLLLLTLFDLAIVGLTWREYVSSRDKPA